MFWSAGKAAEATTSHLADSNRSGEFPNLRFLPGLSVSVNTLAAAFCPLYFASKTLPKVPLLKRILEHMQARSSRAILRRGAVLEQSLQLQREVSARKLLAH